MELEELTKAINNIDFDDVVKQESREYLEAGYKSIPRCAKSETSHSGAHWA